MIKAETQKAFQINGLRGGQFSFRQVKENTFKCVNGSSFFDYGICESSKYLIQSQYVQLFICWKYRGLHVSPHRVRVAMVIVDPINDVEYVTGHRNPRYFYIYYSKPCSVFGVITVIK